MLGRLFKPHSPSPPGAPKTLSTTLSSQVQKRCHGLWRQRQAELSDDGILSLYKSGNDYKVYNLNTPKKMVVGAGKASLHMKMVTNDGLSLYLKVKGTEMEQWAKRMMNLKFPGKEEETSDAEDESTLSLDDSVVDYEPDANVENIPDDTMTTVYETENASQSGKYVEIGAGLPLCNSRASILSMDATQQPSEEHLEEYREPLEKGSTLEIKKCKEKEEVKVDIQEKEKDKEAEELKEKSMRQAEARTPFPSKDAPSPGLSFKLSEAAMKKVEAIVKAKEESPKEEKKEKEESKANSWRPGHVARMATMIDRKVRAERKQIDPEEA